MRFAIFLASAVIAVATRVNAEYNYCHASHPTVSNYTIPPPTDVLRSVQLVTRHGARTPVNLLLRDDAVYNECPAIAYAGVTSSPSSMNEYNQIPLFSSLNPYSPRLWTGNCIPGQLTNFGIAQHVELGQNLRNIYVEKLRFLDEQYDQEKTGLWIRSTDVWRTRQSAESLLSGLYPSSSSKYRFPIHTFAGEIETMTSNGGFCPRWNELMNNVSSSDEWKKHVTDNIDFMNHLTAAMNQEKASSDWFSSFDHYFDQSHVRFCHNKTLTCNYVNQSNCITADDVSRVGELVDWEYRYTYQNFNRIAAGRLGISGFLAEILRVATAHTSQSFTTSNKKMNENVNDQDSSKFVYYSGHDTTIGPLLGALDVSDWRTPPYASNLIFELWERSSSPLMNTVDSNNSKFYIRLISNGDILKLSWCGGQDECDFDTFSKFVGELIPDDLLAECI